jgi:hypothetical protein
MITFICQHFQQMNHEHLDLFLEKIQIQLHAHIRLIDEPFEKVINELISKDGKYFKNFTFRAKEKILKMFNCKA